MAFPSSPDIGDLHTENGVQYFWDGVAWVLKGHAGPTGAQGIQGVQGSQGTQGSSGPQGIQGFVGIQGARGLQGIQGIQGTQGTQGIQGLQGIQGFQGLQGQNGTGVGDMLKSENLFGLENYTTARFNLGLGSSATENIGTSGATIPLLNGTNIWSGLQSFTGGIYAPTDGTLPLGNVKLGRSSSQYIDFHGAAGGHYIGAVSPASNVKHLIYLGISVNDGASYEATFRFDGSNSSLVETVRGYTFWSSGNDGSGSGLDADLLDGYHVGTSGAAVPLLNGTNTWSGSHVWASGQLARFTSGLTIGADNDAYIYPSGTKTISVRVGDSAAYKYFSFNEGGAFLTPDGSLGAPGWSFLSDTNSGIYRIGADNPALVAGATLVMDWATTRARFALPVQLPDGTAAAPSLTFTNDSNTGVYSAGADILGFATAGSARFGMTSYFYGGGGNGSPSMYSSVSAVGTPGYSFVGDTDTGMYWVSANILAFATGGTERLRIGTNGAHTITADGVSTTALTITGSGNGTIGPGMNFSWTNSGAQTPISQSIGRISWGGYDGALVGETWAYMDIMLTDITTGAEDSAFYLTLMSGGSRGVKFTVTDAGTGIFTGLLRHGAGNASFPMLSYSGDTDTGFYWSASGIWAFASNGVAQFSFSDYIYGPSTGSSAVKSGVGSAAAPGYTFTGDTNTGIYWIAADQLGFATGGSLRWYVDTDGSLVHNSGVLKGPVGSAAAPGYTFTGDTNTGMYWVGADHIGWSVGGVSRLQLLSSGHLYVNPNCTTDSAAMTLGNARSDSGYAYIDFVGDTTYTDYALRILREPDGANARSTILHRGTGDFVIGAQDTGAIKFNTAGSTRLTIGSTGEATFTGAILAAAGAAATPSISFSGDTNTGFFNPAADTIRATVGGTGRWDFQSTGHIAALANYRIFGGDGSVGSCAFSFSSDTNTGMYRIGTDNIGFATAGVLRLSIGSTGDVILTSVGPTDVYSAGYRGTPINSQAGNYTGVLADAGCTIYYTGSGGHTFTIPANASVVYPIGTTITIINSGAGSLSIAITTDVMRLAGAGTTGTRTLASHGMATAVKVTSTLWYISGNGLT